MNSSWGDPGSRMVSALDHFDVLDVRVSPTARAAVYFAAHGITRIERVMTDNAFAYRYSKDLAVVLDSLTATQKFIRPHCPWQNGKVERLNRTLATEWAYRQAFTATLNAASPLRPGSSSTTLNDVTPHSEANHQSAGCNQRHDRVHVVVNGSYRDCTNAPTT
jgi:hypothetical protein